MITTKDDGGLAAKLAAPAANVLDQHRDAVCKLLGGQSGDALRTALANDENVRKVAMFCYPLLPGLVRLAVKEPAFIGFVLDNREKLFDRIVKAQAA